MDHDCVEDSSVAISKLSDASSDIDSVMKVKLLLRRGIAQCRLGNLSYALDDYRKGNELLSLNSSLSIPGLSLTQVTSEVEELEKIVAADEKKKEGDQLFAQREVALAADRYTEALEFVPQHVGCLSNRSACKIALGDLNGSVEDCNIAISLLQSDNSPQSALNGPMPDSALSMLYAVIPPAGSEKRKSWLIKTAVRRGAVLAQMGNLVDAARDYGLALSLDPSNKDLQTDLQNIVNARAKRNQQGVSTHSDMTLQ